MAPDIQAQARMREEISELCDDLVEHVEESQQAESIATAEAILQRVRQYFGASGR